jgi:hypothetical protein
LFILLKFNKINIIIKYFLFHFAVPIIDYLCPIKYSPNQKYSNEYFFICLLEFVDSGVYWNKFKGTNEYPIKGKYLNQIHNKYVKKGVYREIHKEILNKYLKIDRECKLKYQLIDSSFILFAERRINLSLREQGL